MQADLHDALRRYFHFDDFLDNQQSIVERIADGHELCVVMPTGAGKSLCYQLPILMLPGYGIVVSPLISLMKDQVDALRERNIPAGCINSTVPFREQCAALDEVAAGRMQLLYVAPERFSTDFFRHFLQRCPPHIMVVDEAHCISQWGHDFRPAYRHLGDAANEFNIPQICAFTATATPHVRDDIREQLHRPEMEMAVAGFKRPNLAFSIVECSSDESKLTAVKRFLQKKCPTIIYASTRKAVELLAKTFGVIAYHAGMSDEDRTSAQERFMNDPCPVLAATNAFGMGIDRPDVRQVIHFNLPGSLEAYYQEAGRAGRDGENAECILLFAYRDRFIQEFLIDMNNPPPVLVHELYELLLKKSEELQTTSLSLSAASLLEELDTARSESQVTSGLAVLEKVGLLTRGYRRESRGQLQFHGELAELSQLHASESTQRARFISRCIKHFGGMLCQGLETSVADLAPITGLREEQVRRVLNALSGDCLEWQLTFRGRGIELLHPEIAHADLDEETMNRKRDYELSRLDEVLGYAKCRTCRQAYLIGYFGEDASHYQCGSCDTCTATETSMRRAPSEMEKAIIHFILCAAAEFDGHVGSGKLSQILAGKKSAELASSRLARSQWFGKLKNLRQNRVLQYVKALENNGALGREQVGEFSCLTITARGCEILDGHAEAQLDLPDYSTPISRGRVLGETTGGKPRRESRGNTRAKASENAENASSNLYEALRKLRVEIASQRGVPPYMVLSNQALQELAERRPQSVEEAGEINGIGPVKQQTVVPRFLQCLQEFSETDRER